jgi:NAD-dependent SIR2 family protein deacetylase
VRALVVLGAGASIGAQRYQIESSVRASMHRMPSGPNFFYDIFRLENARRGRRFLNFLGLTYTGTNDFLVRAWGLTSELQGFDPEQWRGLNIEEVFTFLDTGEQMYRRGTDYRKAFTLMKDYLQDFISVMLSMRSDGQHCERLIEVFARLSPEDDILSFNWDTIADRTLETLGISQFAAYKELLQVDRIKLAQFRNTGVLLKLHGSLNWTECSNRKCAVFGRPHMPLLKDGQLPRWTDKAFEACEYCGAKKPRKAIIPPISNKLVHRKEYFHQLWMLAREKIARTNRIILIGYSFPVTDFLSEWLFRQIHLLLAPKPSIVVVNPEAVKLRSQTRMRYQSVFRGCKIEYHSDFESYVNALGSGHGL